MPKIKCVTINTDASFKNGIGGYAFCIVSDMFRIKKGGYFKDMCKNCHEAEMMSIANALHVLSHSKGISNIGLLVVNTDSLACIRVLKGEDSKLSRSKAGRATVKLLSSVSRQFGCRVSLRHVKAHTGKDDARSHVNEWCDKEAKAWRVKRENMNFVKKFFKDLERNK